jgi:hypothetical protein
MADTEGHLLASVASTLVPGYLNSIDWADIWDRPLETGAAFEWTMLAALAAEANQLGWRFSFPVLDIYEGRALFVLRNEIPRHHGAQAGHAAQFQQSISLQMRFLQTFVPKLLLEKGDSCFSIFREGCPYHSLMISREYKERPDILFLPGKPTQGYPKLNDSIIEFSFVLNGGAGISGSLRAVNSPSVHCIARTPSGGFQLPVTGIIECSVNKPAKTAERQLNSYSTLFGYNDHHVPIFLVTGNDLSATHWPGTNIDLKQTTIEDLRQSFRDAASAALSHLSIL